VEPLQLLHCFTQTRTRLAQLLADALAQLDQAGLWDRDVDADLRSKRKNRLHRAGSVWVHPAMEWV
jgi:hypothetical protein